MHTAYYKKLTSTVGTYLWFVIAPQIVRTQEAAGRSISDTDAVYLLCAPVFASAPHAMLGRNEFGRVMTFVVGDVAIDDLGLRLHRLSRTRYRPCS